MAQWSTDMSKFDTERRLREIRREADRLYGEYVPLFCRPESIRTRFAGLLRSLAEVVQPPDEDWPW